MIGEAKTRWNPPYLDFFPSWYASAISAAVGAMR